MSLEENNKELRDFFRENYTDKALPVSPKVWDGVATSLEGMRLAKGYPTSTEANNNELKDFFSKSYSDMPLTVSPEVWETVAANLEAKRKKRRGGYWMWAALIGVSLLTTTYLLYPSDTQEETSQKIIQDKPAHSADSEIESGETDVANLKPSSDPVYRQADALVDEQASKNESNADQQFDQTSTSDAGIDSFDSEKVKSESPKSDRKNMTSEEAISTMPGNQIQKVPDDVSNKYNSSDDPKDQVVNEEQNETNSEIDPGKIGDSNVDDNTTSESNQPNEVGLTDNWVTTDQRDDVEINPLDKPQIGPIVVIPPSSEFSMIGVEIEKPLARISTWELSLYAGTGKRNRFIVNDNNPDDLLSKKFIKLNPDRKRYQQSGILLGYNIGNHFTVNLGVQSAQWKYRSREFQKLVIKEPTDYEMDAPVGRVATDPDDLDDFYSTTTADTLLFRIRMSQSLRYFSVPLSLKFKFGTKKVQPYIRGGVAANFLFWQRTNLIFRNGGLVRDFERVNVDGMKKVHFSGQGAFGFQWGLAPKISMFAEGQLDFPISNFYQQQAGDITIRTRGVGANVGITFKL